MQRRQIYFFLALFIFVGTTVACGLLSRDNGTVSSSTSPEQSINNESSQNAGEKVQSGELDPSLNSTVQQDSSSTIVPDQGAEYRSEEGGYAFTPIPDYQFEEIFGLVTMIAPDANQDLGPVIMMIGGLNNEEITSDQIFSDFMKEAESENIEILDQKEITVDGKSGLLAEIAGDVDGQQVIGKIVVVAVTPNQQFTLFATSPRDRWGEIESPFENLLGSIYFFEPQEMDITEDLTESGSESGEPQDQNIQDIPNIGDFPTEASQLPPGGFAYLLAHVQGFPTIITQGYIQDQSTDAEYVISLVSEDQETSLTILIPFEIDKGLYQMKSYDSSVDKQVPGAVVFTDLTTFNNTDGIIVVDSIVDNKITGSTFFSAVDQDGNEIAVSGFFNQLSLDPR